VDPGPASVAPPLPRRPAWHYAAAFAAYVALGLVLKTVVLNWIVGPFFLVGVFHLLPRLGRRGSPTPPSAGP